MRIFIKRPISTTLTRIKPATSSATTDLNTELATNFSSSPPNYDPSQFRGLTYVELAAKKPPKIPQKPKKKTHTTPITIDPSPKKMKIPTPHPLNL